jgi:AraC-like DNA-binding protein
MRNIIGDNTSITNNPVILDAIGYINSSYRGRRVLDGFCRQYHFTPQYISRIFKQETGVTVREYLQKVRMEKCCELLAGSDMPISEIAQAAGYSDIKFFNEFLSIIPRNTLYRVSIIFVFRGIVTHYINPLLLSNRKFTKVEMTFEYYFMRR